MAFGRLMLYCLRNGNSAVCRKRLLSEFGETIEISTAHQQEFHGVIRNVAAAAVRILGHVCHPPYDLTMDKLSKK